MDEENGVQHEQVRVVISMHDVMERVREMHVQQNVQQPRRVQYEHIVKHEQVAVHQRQEMDIMWRVHEQVDQVYVQHDIIVQQER